MNWVRMSMSYVKMKWGGDKRGSKENFIGFGVGFYECKCGENYHDEIGKIRERKS